MKYILNENIKSILNEKFILTEAEDETEANAEDTAKEADNTKSVEKSVDKAELANILQTSLDALSNKIEQTTNYANRINKLISDTETIKNSDDFNTVLSFAKTYCNDVIKLLNDMYGNYAWKQKFPDIENKLHKNQNAKNKLDKFNLVHYLDAIANKVGEVKNDVIIKAIKYRFKDIIELNNLVKNDTAISELLKKYNDLNDSLNKISKLVQQSTTVSNNNASKIKNDLVIDEKDNLTNDKLDKLQTTANEVQEALEQQQKEEAEKAEAQKQAEEERKKEDAKKAEAQKQAEMDAEFEQNKEKEDWAKLFAENAGNVGAVQRIWDRYYASEWGKNADAVKALGSAFVIETDHFGYSSITNPFIAFLKTAFNNGITIQKDTYAGIHNAFSHHYINKNDLQSVKNFNFNIETTETEPASTNLLELRSLYTKSGRDVEEYLKLYDAAKKIDDRNKIFVSNGLLNSISDIKTKLAQRNIDIDEKQSFNLMTLSTWLGDINKKKTEYQNFSAYLLQKYVTNFDMLQKYYTKYPELQTIMTNLSLNSRIRFNNILAKMNMEISPANMNEIIDLAFGKKENNKK